MTDADFVYRFLIDTLVQTVVIGFWLVACTVFMAWLSPPLLLVAGALALVVGGTAWRGVRRHLGLTGERFARLSELSSRARDVVELERVVLARQFGLGDFFLRDFGAAHERYTDVVRRQGRVNAGIVAVYTTLGGVAFVVLVAAGSLLISAGGLDVSGLLVILFVNGQLLAAVAQLGETAGRAAETTTASKRLAAYWDAETSTGAAGDEADDAQPDRIESMHARAVSFAYGAGVDVLSGIDLDLRRGELACLTAETGAGKTTLALLLSGILTPTSGEIDVRAAAGADQVAGGAASPDPRVLPPQSLGQGRLLYIGSKPILLEGSVRDNLLLADPETVTDEELAKFFAGLTRGGVPFPVDEPIVGPNGTGLSSGQGQLVQLARAVFRDPEVVIFDEATSSLDMQTEAAVQEQLLSWCRERICLVVSHRRCPWTERADARLSL